MRTPHAAKQLIDPPLDKPMSQTESISATTKIGEKVRDLMISNGIEKAEHSKTLEGILEVRRSQAYKLLADTSGWDMDKIKKVAGHFGVSIAQLTDETNPHSEEPSEATLEVGGKSFRCFVQPGEVIQSGANLAWICFESRGNWFVREGAGAPTNVPLHRVDRLELDVMAPPSVAVLDDDPAAAKSICENLNHRGFRATPFFKASALIKALETDAFDCFVLDWLVGRSTALPAIKAIREGTRPDAPVFLLTGALNHGETEDSLEEDLANVTRTYRLLYKSKPMPPSVLAVEISSELERRK